MTVLGIVEIGRKQSYIFQSNRLKEVVGASGIIRHVSETLHHEELKHELEQQLSEWGKDNIVNEGGGHSLFWFRTREDGVAFNQLLSRRVLKCYPGIQLNSALIEFDPHRDLLPNKLKELHDKMALKKNTLAMPLRQYSYGIERLCESTQMPAVEQYRDDPPRWVSADIAAKLREAGQKGRFDDLLPPEGGWSFAVSSDELQDEKGKIAVIHLDGNQMGAKIQKFNEWFVRRQEETVYEFNRRYQHEFREFARLIDTKYKAAFTHMLRTISLAVEQSKDHPHLSDYKGKKIPIRPIIFAGDDVSFLMPGILGVEAARIMLEQLQQDPIVLSPVGAGTVNITMHACAGIALVRSGYPFARAHELAEQLCSASKTQLLQDRSSGKLKFEDASMLDFHILHGDWTGSVAEQRRRNYAIRAEGGEYSLTMKPLYIMNHAVRKHQEVPSNQYETFRFALTRVTDQSVARSKIKRLRECIRRGPAESERFLQLTQLNAHLISTRDTPMEKGKLFTHDGICPYYDAIEAMDDVELLPERDVKQ